MPCFRPDGRLDRLNHGGGSKLPKTIPGEPMRFQKQPDLIRLMALASYQSKNGNKTKELDLKAGYQGGPYGVKGQVSGQKTPSGKSKVMAAHGTGAAAGTGTSAAGAVYSERAPATASATAGVMAKKRRTLLSGEGGSSGQTYGSETILGG